MDFFGNSKPQVSNNEYHHKVKAYLHEKGFTHHDLERLDGILQGSLNETGHDRGMDHHEIGRTVEWLSHHKHEHHFDDEKIGVIDHALRKYL